MTTWASSPNPNGPHVEVVTKSVDVRLPPRRGGRQGSTTPRSGSESLQVFHFIAVEPAAVTAHVLDPSELLLVEAHRTAGRGHPPWTKALCSRRCCSARCMPGCLPRVHHTPAQLPAEAIRAAFGRQTTTGTLSMTEAAPAVPGPGVTPTIRPVK